MRKRTGVTAVPGVLIALLWLAAHAAAAPAPADSTVKPLCAVPAPGHAGCLGLRLVPASASAAPAGRAPLAGARASPVRASTPPELHEGFPGTLFPDELASVYALPSEAAGGEPTIVLVDAFDDPTAEADLAVFDAEFGLPACTAANHCFKKVNGEGHSSPLPEAEGAWAGETATDIEVVHSLCRNCRIVLVEAHSDTYADLEVAEDTAAAVLTAAGASGAISNSWGGEEDIFDSSAFDHPGLAIAASSGDNGYLNWNHGSEPSFVGADYPASSPHVIAVGGTSVHVNASETVWSDSGGGCSESFAAPSWQTHASGWPAVGCGSRRAVADVAADADPYTGVYVYDSTPDAPSEPPPGWEVVGGTSVAAPIVASAFALAGGAHGVPYPAATLYAHAGTAALHDITAGANGKCDGVYGSCSFNASQDCGPTHTICNAASAFDGPTGVGTPNGLAAFLPLPVAEGSGEEAQTPPAPPAGEAGSGGGTGGPENPPSPGTSPSGVLPPVSLGTEPAGAAPAPRLSHLALTHGAMAALNRGRPVTFEVAFGFTLSAPATVRATLMRRVRVAGHWRWLSVAGPRAFVAVAGFNRVRLRGHRALAAGLYRLRVAPARGTARSTDFAIG